MAGRTKSGFQRAMWDMVRMRIQDFRNVQIALTGTVTVTQQTGQPAQQIQFTHNTTLGAIFTSEKANAILLRWHVFRPAHVATTTENNSYVAQTIRRVITDNPTLRWDNPVADWTDVQEAKLTEAILTRGNAVPESGNSFTKAAGWPTYTGRNGNGYAINNQLGALRITRNSFTLDTAGF
jgi:hypothetical protein